MNEHIEKLANVWANRRSKDEKLGITYTFSESALEQFAKLIVEECMNICEQQRRKILQNPNDPSWTEHLAECQISMKQIFGVK